MDTAAAEQSAPAETATAETTATTDAAPPVKADATAVAPPKESDSDRFAKLLHRETKQRAKLEAERAEITRLRAEADARVKAAEDAAKQVSPLLEAIKTKDFKKLLAETGMSPEDLVSLIAGDEERAPTPEELEERAADKAVARLRAEHEAKAKADAEAAAAKAKEDEESKEQAEQAAKAKHQARIVDALEKGGEEFAQARAVEKLYSSLGYEDGVVSKAALDLTVKVYQKTGELITIPVALAQIQKQLGGALEELKGLFVKAPATKNEQEKSKSSGAVQPTLSNRTTTGLASADTEPNEDDEVDAQEAIRRAARRAGLRMSA